MTEPGEATKLVGAGAQGTQGEAESWLCNESRRQRGDFIAVCNSQLGRCGDERETGSSGRCSVMESKSTAQVKT